MFTTFDASPADSLIPITSLFINVDPGAGTSTINIDNIVLGESIPEPNGLSILGLGALVSFLAWRRFRAAA